MAIYRIAELDIEITPRYDRTAEYLADYRIDSDAESDFAVTVTDEMLAYERDHAEQPSPEWAVEAIAILRVICDRVLEQYDGFFLHCSCLMIDGMAVVFTAPSGTGKSTHARMWRERFKDRVTMINDDKPLVRRKGGDFYIYGTPWNGKHGLSNNISAPIRAVYFLQQGDENRCESVDAVTALTLLLRQTVIPADRSDLSALLDMLSELIERTPMFTLVCNISRDAADTAYQALIGAIEE